MNADGRHIQERESGENTVTREPRKPPGYTQSPTRTVRHPRTWGTSSAIQHHADKLCGKERGVNQGAGRRGGVHRGQETTRPQRQRKKECAHRNQPWGQFAEGHLESAQYSRPPAPLPAAVSPPAPPRAARIQQRRKSSQLHLQLLPATGGKRREFWVRVPPSCPAERRGKDLQQHDGAGNPRPLPST